MNKFLVMAVVTLGIWTAAAAILAFGVLARNPTGNPLTILVLIVAMVSTVALWKWGRAERVDSQQPNGQRLGAEQDTDQPG